jgi:hypothetical protein
MSCTRRNDPAAFPGFVETVGLVAILVSLLLLMGGCSYLSTSAATGPGLRARPFFHLSPRTGRRARRAMITAPALCRACSAS